MERWKPRDKDDYFIPSVEDDNWYTELTWNGNSGDSTDLRLYSYGLVFKTKEEAIAMTEAFLDLAAARFKGDKKPIDPFDDSDGDWFSDNDNEPLTTANKTPVSKRVATSEEVEIHRLTDAVQAMQKAIDIIEPIKEKYKLYDLDPDEMLDDLKNSLAKKLLEIHLQENK